MVEAPAPVDGDRETVESRDGTRIGFRRVGSGPVPVVIVHGALNSGEQWVPVASELADACTCYVMDRWGRGLSDDRSDYSLEREVEDVEAVLQAAGSDAYLLGHSSGAIYALEVARRAPVAGLILYEPPLHGFHGRFVPILDRIRAAVREERHEEALLIFLRDEAERSEEELTFLQTTPLWQHMASLTPHSLREWDELLRVRATVDRYRDVSVPTLLLTGSETEDHPSFATRELAEMWPEARVAGLDGQGHAGNLAAPALVAQEIGEFIRTH